MILNNGKVKFIKKFGSKFGNKIQKKMDDFTWTPCINIPSKQSRLSALSCLLKEKRK